MSSPLETDSLKSPEILEQEINDKRESISNLVDSLESRFTPGQLFDQALAYARGNGGEFFQNLGTTLKNNPVPTALTGLGIAWLAMSQNKPYKAASAGGPSLSEKISSFVDQATGTLSHAGDRLHSAADAAKDHGRSISDQAADLTLRAKDALDNATDTVSETAHHAHEQLSAQASLLKGQFDNLMDKQPLVLAAVGVALGAIIGAALPSTRKEDEIMGPFRDDTVAKVKDVGQYAIATAREPVAQDSPQDTCSPLLAETTPAPAEGGTDLSGGLGIRP